MGVEARRRPAAQARPRCQNAAPPRASLPAPEAGPTPATASYASALTTNRLDAALFTNQARCLVSEPEARTAARRPAMGVHVSMEQRAEARFRPRLPAPAADDGRGGGARCGAASGGCGARREEEEPAGIHAHDEQARARVKSVRSRRMCTGAGVCTERERHRVSWQPCTREKVDEPSVLVHKKYPRSAWQEKRIWITLYEIYGVYISSSPGPSTAPAPHPPLICVRLHLSYEYLYTAEKRAFQYNCKT